MSMSTEELREKVQKKIAANPGVKTSMMAETLGVKEVDVLRVMPMESVTELQVTDSEKLIRALERLGSIYFVLRNESCVSEVKGSFGEFSRSGPFLNTSGRNIHLHIRTDRIIAAFAVRAGGSPDVRPMLSLQFFQQDGASSFKVFIIESLRTEAGEAFEVAEKVFGEIVGEFSTL